MEDDYDYDDYEDEDEEWEPESEPETRGPSQPPQQAAHYPQQYQAGYQQQGMYPQRQNRQIPPDFEQRITTEFPDLNNPDSALYKWTRYYLHTEYNELNPATGIETAAHRAHRHLEAWQRAHMKEQQAKPKQPETRLPARSRILAKRWKQPLHEVEAMHKKLSY